MVSLLVHAILGIVVIAIIVKSNPADLQARPGRPAAVDAWRSSTTSSASRRCRSAGTSTSASCTSTRDEPVLGSGRLVAVHRRWDTRTPRPVRSAADYTIGNVILLPLFTIIDGSRRGIRRPVAVPRVQLVHQLRLRAGPSTWPPSNGSAGTNTQRCPSTLARKSSGPADCTCEGSPPQLRNPVPARLRRVGVPRAARRNRQRSGTDRHRLRVEGLRRSRAAGGTVPTLHPPGAQPCGGRRQSGRAARLSP